VQDVARLFPPLSREAQQAWRHAMRGGYAERLKPVKNRTDRWYNEQVDTPTRSHAFKYATTGENNTRRE